MIAMEEKAAREALAVKAAKEAEEALRKQSDAITSFGERVSQFMEEPAPRGEGRSLVRAYGSWSLCETEREPRSRSKRMPAQMRATL
jgi:hypothetical protein